MLNWMSAVPALILLTAITLPAAEPRPAMILRGQMPPIHNVVFSPDGRQLCTSEGTCLEPMICPQLEVWEVLTGQTVRVLDRGQGKKMIPIHAVAYSPAGKRLAGIRFGTNEAVVWDLVTGREVFSLGGFKSKVGAIAFSPNGRQIVAGGGWPLQAQDDSDPPGEYPKGEIKVWDATTGKVVFDLQGHPFPVEQVAFNTDGKRLLSWSLENTLFVWDAGRLHRNLCA